MSRIKALTFNMQFGQRWDEADPDAAPIDFEGTIEFLRSREFDLLLLQEVERARPGGEQPDPAPNYLRLKHAFRGWHSVFAWPPLNPDELPFGIGLSIFSRTPLADFFHDILPAPDVIFDFQGKRVRPSERSLIGVKTEVDGRQLCVMNTHLQAFFMIGTTSNEHRGQRDAVEQRLAEVDCPAIMSGDFNIGPDEDTVAQFERAGFQAVQNEEITWRRKPFVLDHFFHNARVELESYEVVPTETSDHHALEAVFRF